MNWLDAAGAITGALCVLLLIVKSVWNWPAAILNAIVFLISFLAAGLYGDASLQVVFVAISVYGWFFWLRGGAARHEPPIVHLSLRGHLISLVAIAIATALFATVLQKWLHSTASIPDGLTTALSLAAIVLQSRKYLENWYYWIVADIIYVPLYLSKSLPLTALLYAAFIPMCIAGILTWRRSPAGVR